MQRLEWSWVAVISNQTDLNFVNAKHILVDVAEKHGIKAEFKMETSLIPSQQVLQELQNLVSKS